MPLLTRRLFVLGLHCAPWAFSKGWDNPAFPSWPPEFIDKLLTDSPWATASTVRIELDKLERLSKPMLEVPSSFQQIELPPGIGLPRGGSRFPGAGWPGGGSASGSRIPPARGPQVGGGGSAEIFLTTRWASALPVRRARALQQLGRERLGSQQAADLLNTPPSEYVLEIAGFPATVVRQGAERFAAELKDSARLSVPGRPAIAASSCEMPEHGMHLMATLSFPRLQDLHPKEGYVELSAGVRGIKLGERFKLKEMLYNRNLEL